MIRGQITGHSQVIPMGRPVGSTIICSHTLQDESRRFADAASLRGGEHEKRSFWRSKVSTSDSSFGGNSDGQCPTPKRDAVRQAIAKQPFEQPWLGRPFVSDRCRLPKKGHTGILRRSLACHHAGLCRRSGVCHVPTAEDTRCTIERAGTMLVHIQASNRV
jgi:hypothetical protein